MRKESPVIKLLREVILRQVPCAGHSPEEPIAYEYADSGKRIVYSVDNTNVHSIENVPAVPGVSRILLKDDPARVIFIEGTIEAVKAQLELCTVQEREKEG